MAGDFIGTEGKTTGKGFHGTKIRMRWSSDEATLEERGHRSSGIGSGQNMSLHCLYRRSNKPSNAFSRAEAITR